jgi:hypothetical protein
VRPADALRAARLRIENPARWAQGSFATVDGERAGVLAVGDPSACLCVNGALLSVGCLVAGFHPPGGLYLSIAAKALGYETASKLNDAPETTHADVLALLDLAIRLAEAAEEVPS